MRLRVYKRNLQPFKSAAAEHSELVYLWLAQKMQQMIVIMGFGNPIWDEILTECNSEVFKQKLLDKRCTRLKSQKSWSRSQGLLNFKHKRDLEEWKPRKQMKTRVKPLVYVLEKLVIMAMQELRRCRRKDQFVKVCASKPTMVKKDSHVNLYIQMDFF